MQVSKKKIRIGTRGSSLALAQTNLVIDAIREHYPKVEFEIVVIKTIGDKILDKPLLEFGGKGVFVSEFEEAIIDNKIDIAIHSAKDMPMELAEGLDIVGVLKREDPRDVLITMKSAKLDEKKSLVIGTSSLRRKIQIEQLYNNVVCNNLRGNVNTRLNKLADGLYDGIILAAAGIKRLKLDNQDEYNYTYLDFDQMIPAGGQGIIAIEGRTDSGLNEIFRNITDANGKTELEIERMALKIFGAGCHEPIGVFSNVDKNEVTIRMVRHINGKILKRKGNASVEKRIELVQTMAKSIMEES